MPWSIQNAFGSLARYEYLPNGEQFSSLFLYVIIAAFIGFLSTSVSSHGLDQGFVYDIGGFSIFNAWRFFTQRYDFVQAGFRKSGGRTFRFKVLQHQIIAMAGETSRKAFFNEPGLSFSEGYKILLGGAPQSKDIVRTGGEVPSDVEEAEFVKQVSSLVRRDRLEAAIPILLEDLHTRLASDWGHKCRIEPFKHVREAVFQMTVRLSSCQELAEDRKSIDDLMESYSALERSATPVSQLLPWFPGPAKKSREKATTKLFTVLQKFVMLRRQATSPTTDAIDVLIKKGHGDQSIVGTIMRTLFAGVSTTSAIASWTLLRLASNPKWMNKAIEEYKTLVEEHSTTPARSVLQKRLSDIPLTAWEEELPSTDLIIRETIRLTSAGSIIRRNMQNDIIVDGATVRRGDFVTYQVADAHLNPDIYPDPLRFDPLRFVHGREEDQKEIFGYIGWGAGRHPCVGMRAAKLEIKLLLGLILLGYEYELVDGTGNHPKELPMPDKNDNHQALPLGGPYFLNLTRVVD